jgi:nitric oxide reductase subunit B
MNNIKSLWLVVGLAVAGAFLVLGFFGREVYKSAPPIPERVVTENGRVLFDRESILLGQQVWQSMGGQQVGSIWGHGAYQAPDWSADWLHRESTALLDLWAQKEHGKAYAELDRPAQASLGERLREVMRSNTLDPGTRTLTLGAERARAVALVAQHYDGLFGRNPELQELRASYAIVPGMVDSAERRQALTHFFFWTSWACATERPGTAVTYTNNWPHEPLVGNHPTGANLVWSILSVALLIGGIGAMVYFRTFRSREEPALEPPASDPLDAIPLTPSMRAVGKYVGTVVAMFVAQVLLGALTAHYTIEGNGFYGLPLPRLLPYVVTRTWHIQLGVFWIATSFLAAGLFLAPAVGGREPRHQRFGVNALFGALVLVVAGSLGGEWATAGRHLDLGVSYWLGRQGYEYVDLGRLWQIALFVGLLLWLALMLRGLWPALARRDSSRHLVLLFVGASAAIGLFYGAGFFYGARTHLSVMEYWRWWVVHLWVEGFMEVFATAALAFIFSRLGLVRPSSAVRAALLSTALFLVSGVPGTFHHLYFSGTPVSIMAVGASFSALEVVPLALVGFEAWETHRLGRSAPWMASYRWPIRFFLGVAFWNLVGAGLFGFLINPPIALYFLQGLNTTPVHGHAALFGVYGLLGLGLSLVVLRRLAPGLVWRERALGVAFWGMNVGLGLMIALSLLPVGLVQAVASVDRGLWYARSAELLGSPLITELRWLRIVGDTVFLVGTGAFAWFVIGLRTGWSVAQRADLGAPGAELSPAE